MSTLNKYPRRPKCFLSENCENNCVFDIKSKMGNFDPNRRDDIYQNMQVLITLKNQGKYSIEGNYDQHTPLLAFA